MLISHEVPISLLEKSQTFNDYDYCLLHLTYIYPEYKDYYINAVREGRKVLLDNSLFELGDALTNEALARGVVDLNPTYYVVPDCLNNREVTVGRFEEFEEDYGDLPGCRIGVVQGNSLKDLESCYRFMSEHADKVAIPFDSAGFEEITSGKGKLERWCNGRQSFISYLVSKGIWNNSKPHHLLGCSLAREFNYPLYRKINIESVDTSNPVVAAIKKLSYGENGLNEKPDAMLCDLISTKLTEEQLDILKHNVTTFRRICNG